MVAQKPKSAVERVTVLAPIERGKFFFLFSRLFLEKFKEELRHRGHRCKKKK
jgi:hypothetical protein